MSYIWNANNIPPLAFHTAKKLELIEGYFNDYLTTVGKGGFRRVKFPLCFVDGFSGGGVYQQPSGSLQHGSPLLALEAALNFEHLVNSTGMKVYTNFMFIFIDKNEITIKYLKNQVEEWKKNNNVPLQWKIIPIVGEFEKLSPKVIQAIKSHTKRAERAIFILDQYGYSQVKISTIQHILSELKGAEVILTISTDWLVDKSNEDQLSERLLAMDLSHSGVEKLHVALKQPPPIGMTSAQYNRQKCQEFVIDAIASSSRFFNQYCIHSPESGKSYVIVQLTKNIKGKDVMLEQFWKGGRFATHELVDGLYVPTHHTDHDSFLFAEEYEEKTRSSLQVLLLKQAKLAGEISALELYVNIANSRTETKLMIYEEIRMLQLKEKISAMTTKGNTAQRIKDNTKLSIDSQQNLFLPVK